MKGVVIIFGSCFLFSLLCLWPLLSAGFRTDDWGWLALAHMLENPFSSYTNNILWGYFYRPSAMVFWWIAERIAGDNSTWHYLINIILHSASASCLVFLLRAAGRPVWLSFGIGLAYVCSPAIVGAALWLSSRNEMLAIFAGLCSMIVLEHEINTMRFRGFAISFLLFVALTAKESAYLLPIACTLRILIDTDLRRSLTRKNFTRIAFSLFTPLVLAAILRGITIFPIGPEANPSSLFQTMYVGIKYWLQLWPSAISGFDSQRIYWLYIAALSTLFVLMLGAVRISNKSRAWSVSALVLIFCPAALQAPITSTILNQANAIDFAENLRFFSTSALGTLLLIGMCLPLARFRWLSGISLSLLLLVGGYTSFNLATTWRDNTKADDHQARQLAAQISKQMNTIQCPVLSRIIIKADVSPSIAPWIDPALKSQWPRDARIQNCSFFVKSIPSYYQIVPLIECDSSRWTAQTSSQFLSRVVSLPLDSVCQTSMVQPNESNATAVIELPTADR